jgi:hypothetical protein
MPVGTFETINTSLLTSSQSAIVFSNIPSTYTDLVIVLLPVSDGANFIAVQFNTDTSGSGTNYSRLAYSSTGVSPYADIRASRYAIEIDTQESTGSGGPNSTNEINIFNYTSTSAYKTIFARNSSGARNGGSNAAGLGTGTWRSYDVINSVRLTLNAGSFTSGTRATLYGIKAGQ